MTHQAGEIVAAEQAWNEYAAHMRRAQTDRALVLDPAFNSRAEELRLAFQREFRP